MKEGNSKTQLNRRYPPQDLGGWFSDFRAYYNIFLSSSRTRKIVERSIQTIHLTKAWDSESRNSKFQKIWSVPISTLCTLTPLEVFVSRVRYFRRKLKCVNVELLTGLKPATTIILLFAICYLLFVPRCEVASEVGAGDTVYCSMRKIICNAWGYWVFYDDGVGNSVWKYSSDGVNRRSDGGYTSQYNKVFDDVSGSYATPALEGRALDEYNNLEKVMVCLKQCVGGPKYWKGGPDFEVGYDTSCWQVATGTTSSQYTGFSDWEHGQRYRLWSKAYDNAGNIENVPDSNITGDIGGKYFGYDESAPISSVSSPQDGDCFNETTVPSSITENATDPINGSGVDQVLVNIRCLPTGTTTYLAWKGLVWGAPGDYEINCDAFPWSVSMPGAWGPYMDGQVIKVRTWSYDKAFPYNSEMLSTKCTFKYDITPPTSTITSPSTSDPLCPYYANISSFTGTAFDSSQGSPSYVKEVGVPIRRSSDNYYWNGSTWTTTSIFDVGTGSDTRSYTNVSNWQNGITYKVNSCAKDEAANFETNFTTFTFACDKAGPTSDNGAYNSTYNRIDRTASDAGVGVNNLVVRIKRSEDSLYWNVNQSTWTVFFATACWMQATNGYNRAHWSVDTSSVTWEDNHYYTHTSKGTDKLGNEEAMPPAKGAEFCYTLPATHFGISMSATVTAGVAEPVTVSALNEVEGVAKSYLGIL